MAWITAMVATSLTAQTTVPDESIDQVKPFTITKVKPQAIDEQSLKAFSGLYYLNIVAAGATLVDELGDYTYGNSGCFYENNLSGAYDVNLHLPDGHEILGYRYFFEDGTAGSSRTYLYAMHGDGTLTQLHSIQSTGNANTYSSVYQGLPTQHFVNNAENFYVLRFESSEIGDDQEMCGARLFLRATP
ncbi:MAG: hypothetical protein DWP95_12925 [Proteobacteria bacterium]|nr:MAG: hypothetical protein DWP95_12925 [Pseudomonadota bacterium]